MVYYLMTNGRSIPEFLRRVKALQTLDEHQVATPEGWRPGDKIIVPPPSDMDAVDVRINERYDCTDWYFFTKAL